jgi:DNA modification methylase
MADSLIHQGDCLEVMRKMDADSVDSIVTDPPYELGFMGKKWDSSGVAYSVDVWAEALRVLKPGGHLLAFGGSRTYHRLACAIEDAGFEIRDQIQWVYASGFPKSLNIGCKCRGDALPYNHEKDNKDQIELRDVRTDSMEIPLLGEADESPLLQLQVQRDSAREGVGEARVQGATRQKDIHSNVRPEESRVEGRGDVQEASRELQGREVYPMPGEVQGNGPEGRVRDGASPDNGREDRKAPAPVGSGASSGSQPRKQRQHEPPDVQFKRGTQEGRAETCPKCGGLIQYKGFGTALKPAHEPLVLARKPLIGTVASNVLAHGTGAINVDGCRVDAPGGKIEGGCKGTSALHNGGITIRAGVDQSQGRWPANVIHDGSEEVTGLFPETGSPKAARTGKRGGSSWHGQGGLGSPEKEGTWPADTGGSAARFFYCAKASKSDRGEGNNHPTVKPTDLMRYLCRLVTPPGGVVLDPFAGSGSTGKAAIAEGFTFIGIELNPEYVAIAEARIGTMQPLFAAV